MKQVLPYIGATGNKEFKEFLAKQFMSDMLFPVYGESLITTIFHGWMGELKYNWSRFTNDEGDILEFYAEGQYVTKTNNESRDVCQLKTPIIIKEFTDDMNRFGVQLYWTDWVVEKYNQ